MHRPARTNPAHPLQGPDRVGHKHSRAKRSVHKCESNRPFCSTLMARWSTASISMFLPALGLAYSSQDRHERGLFTNQLLRETAVEIDPERVERLQRAHARAYQQYSVQIPPPRRAQAARLAHRNTNSLGYLRYARGNALPGVGDRTAQPGVR